MDFKQEHIIEDLYDTGIFANAESTPEYNALLAKYNRFYESIDDEKMKSQFKKLEEMKTKLHSLNDKNTFKVGFSVATKMIVEALNCEI